MQSVQQINKSFHQQSNPFHFIQTKFKLFYNQLKIMNQIYIGQQQHQNIEPNTFYIKLAQSDKYLQILRSDHFNKITIQLPQDINDKQLRFMMHLSRILKQKGQIRLINSEDTQSAQLFSGLALKLGLFDNRDQQNKQYFSKQKVQRVQQTKSLQIKKTAIGFQSNQTQQIDEEQLMKNENINIQKSKVQNCAQKPKACANCNCGRKNNDQPIVPKQKLIESINEGKPVSGCGKCFLGDSFRCGSCPYKGLPAFKPGDKLKLMQEGQVVVQANEVKVQSGKVKIQL